MVRESGRNMWIAVPATALLAVVVGALVWLAAPMVPVAISWVGDSLRSASERAAQESARPPAVSTIDVGAVDCRDLYPDRLWSTLTWTGGSSLAQDMSPPATAIDATAEGLAPDIGVTCRWTRDGPGSIVTSLATVGQDAQAVAEAQLRAQGFACETTGGDLTCERAEGDVREHHAFRDGLWLVSIQSQWRVDDYDAALDDFLFG